MPKNQPVGLKIDLVPESMMVKIAVWNSETDIELDFREFHYADLEVEEITQLIKLYGLSKILQDRTSDNGKGADKIAKLVSMDAVFARFVAGEFKAERKAGAHTTRIEVLALARYRKADVAVIQAALARYKTKADREKVLSNKALLPFIKEITLERESTPEIDFDDMV